MEQLDAIEVWSRYTRAWAPGFEIADETCDGYRVRRVADGVLLPGHFLSGDVRGAELPEREGIRSRFVAGPAPDRHQRG